MTVKTETSFYKTFKRCLENGIEKYIITRIESYVTPGFPDCIIYHKDIGFFTYPKLCTEKTVKYELKLAIN